MTENVARSTIKDIADTTTPDRMARLSDAKSASMVELDHRATTASSFYANNKDEWGCTKDYRVWEQW